MQTTITVSDEQIYNLLCSANYGGISYWCTSDDYRPGTEPHPEGIDGPPGHFEAAPLTGGAWVLRILPDDGDPRGGELHTLDRAACERGIAVMAEKYPRHFTDLVTENDDAITADVFVQCALFGDIIYG